MKTIYFGLVLFFRYFYTTHSSRECDVCFANCEQYKQNVKNQLTCRQYNDHEGDWANGKNVLLHEEMKVLKEHLQNTESEFLSILEDRFGVLNEAQKKVEKCSLGAKYNGSLSDLAFSASSVYSNLDSRQPRHARLYKPYGVDNNDGGWLAAIPYQPTDWLQIDLGESTKVAGVVIQGQMTQNAWMSSYKIKYGDSVEDLRWITEDGDPKIFQGNIDYSGLAEGHFPHSVSARFIRFYMETYYNWPSLYVDILSC